MAFGEWTWKCCLCVFMLYFATSGTGNNVAAGADVTAFRPESSEGASIVDGIMQLTADTTVPVRAHGQNITARTQVSFTAKNASRGSDCDDIRSTEVFPVEQVSAHGDTGIFKVMLGNTHVSHLSLMMCLKDKVAENDTQTPATGSPIWIHQGAEPWLRLRVVAKVKRTTFLPLPIQVLLIIVMLCFSGLFSGLNLGLMSLDKTELRIVANCGTETEKRHAKTISPLRKRGNFLLCTILIGNVMVNNTLTIFMDDLTGSGAVAVVVSTLGIVVFGEIIPQAVCSRHGLAIGAKTIWITKFFMVLTFPLSYPISKVLDLVLGEEVGNVYNRDRLRELLKVTEENIDLVKDEVHIIAGALELSRKTVKDIMTKIDDVYMIEYSGLLDFQTMNEIMKTGFTRVPVYEGDKSNILALLNIKDLAFVDPDDRTPLKTVCKFYNHPVNYVFEDTKLDVMLEEFKKGRSHMSFVQRVNNEGEGDPFYETLGVVTLEDVIEEILQSEIVDETDTITDNRAKRHRVAQTKDFSIFNQPDNQNWPRLSPQLTLATFQYLSTTVSPFKEDFISEVVLQRLIQQNIVVNFKLSKPNTDECYLYMRGKPCDYFILIIEGRVEVDIGKDHMIFEGGPFMYFGVQALLGIPQSIATYPSHTSLDSAADSLYTKQFSYLPDYSVKAMSDLQFLKIRRAFYLAAYRATLMERHPRSNTMTGEQTEDTFTKEWLRATSVDPDRPNRPSDSQDDLKEESVVVTSPSVDGDVPQRTREDEPQTEKVEVAVDVGDVEVQEADVIKM